MSRETPEGAAKVGGGGGRDDGLNRDDDELGQEQIIWFKEDENWELTWPIWHMLPRDERKALALKHGYKTIGDFEEYMTLQRGLTDSSTTTSPYPNNLVYPEYPTRQQADGHDDAKLHANPEEDVESEDEELEEAIRKQQLDAEERLSTDELMRLGGNILMLPDELLHKVFAWLPVDTYATLALVSPHWKAFTRTEAVYRRLCERLYLNQSKRRALHVHRFGNSYRSMLEKRPRVRAGGGVYVMKYTKVKPVQRDMWTEVRGPFTAISFSCPSSLLTLHFSLSQSNRFRLEVSVGFFCCMLVRLCRLLNNLLYFISLTAAILEMVYYRYLYFQEDGRVLYALTCSGPHEMFRRLRKMCLHETDYADPAAVWGTYTVQKTHVTVSARQPWQFVKLEMTIQPQYRLHGKWGYLSFDRHMTSESGNFEDWSNDRVVFDVPEEPFRFVKDKRL